MSLQFWTSTKKLNYNLIQCFFGPTTKTGEALLYLYVDFLFRNEIKLVNMFYFQLIPVHVCCCYSVGMCWAECLMACMCTVYVYGCMWDKLIYWPLNYFISDLLSHERNSCQAAKQWIKSNGHWTINCLHVHLYKKSDIWNLPVLGIFFLFTFSTQCMLPQQENIQFYVPQNAK